MAERQRWGWAPPILIFLAVLAVLLPVSALVYHQGNFDPRVLPVDFAGDDLVGGWCRHDCGWYVYIADHGYSHNEGAQSPVAFFPGYPLTIRTVGRAVDNIPVAGFAVTATCGLLAMVLLWRWCRRRLGAEAALLAVAMLAVYPYAWYLYGAVYGDALFLVCALSAFTLLERGHPVLAGLAGAAATATRPTGVAVVVGLVALTLERRGAFEGTWRLGLPRRLHLGRLRPADAGVLLSVGGLVAYSAYLWHRFGDPFLYSSVQEYWGQPSDPYTWFKLDFAKQFLRGDDRVYAWGLLVQAVFLAIALLLVPTVKRRLGLGYAAYVLALVAILGVGSQDFQGSGRYLLGAFPVFAVLGASLAEHPRAARVVLPTSFLVLVAGTAMFSHGYYLS